MGGVDIRSSCSSRSTNQNNKSNNDDDDDDEAKYCTSRSCTRPTSSPRLSSVALTRVVELVRRTLAVSEKVTTFTKESAPLL